MWKLICTKKDHWEQYMFVEEDCVVGRKDSTLLISNDPSVSRRHAVLTVKHPENNLAYPSRKSSLFMRDEGSKYGTFKNGVRLTGEEQLCHGDIVKFGQFESEFRVHYEALIVTTSCLDNASKSGLKKSILKLGGHIVNEWQPGCTHLVMTSVKITIKALCCLVSLKSIVLPNYFDELYKQLKSSASIVPTSEFIPPIGESLIDEESVSLGVNTQRKDIFNNKAFYFLDEKQYKKLHLGIAMGGGKASILSEESLNSVSYENACFIDPPKTQLTEESSGLYRKILDTLQEKTLRMIPESDVGLAVVYASTEKYCNPTFPIGSAVMNDQRIPSQTLTERQVYAPDTQEGFKRPQPSIKNFLLDSSGSEPRSKKLKVEAPDSLNIESSLADPEDVFEIPLSAEVKQELNDIFDIHMNDDDENVEQVEELPSTLPVEPSPVCQKKAVELSPVREKKPVKLEESKPERTSKRNISPKKSKAPKNTTLVNGNGFLSSVIKKDVFEDVAESIVDESNLPRNLATVKFVSLIVQKPVLSTQEQTAKPGVKNFKKFKKVLPRNMRALPIIIGGHDLVPYDKNAIKLAEQGWDDEPEVVAVNGNCKGVFDWNSQK